MGTRFTSTLVAANLLAVSGLCGLSLVAAIDAVQSGSRTANATAFAPSGASLSGDAAGYPAHAVRVVTHENGRPGAFERGQAMAAAPAPKTGMQPGGAPAAGLQTAGLVQDPLSDQPEAASEAPDAFMAALPDGSATKVDAPGGDTLDQDPLEGVPLAVTAAVSEPAEAPIKLDSIEAMTAEAETAEAGATSPTPVDLKAVEAEITEAEMAAAAEQLALIETAAGSLAEPATTAAPVPATAEVEAAPEADSAQARPQLANLPPAESVERPEITLAEPKPAAETNREAPAQPQAGRPAPEYSRPLPPAVTQSAAAANPPRNTAGTRELGYVVIGSFTDQAEAEGHRQLYKHLKPRLVDAVVKGRQHHRVVVGPFARADLKPAKQRIIAEGIAGAWILLDPALTGTANGKKAAGDARDDRTAARQAQSSPDRAAE